jgi:FixJ family two-component response regulator
MGYPVETFGSAETFLRFLRHHSTDCLVLDMELPGLSGLQLQRHLLETGHFIPIVLITGQDIREFPPIEEEGGLVAFLIKPFDDDVLLRAVRAGIGGPIRPSSNTQGFGQG